MIFGKSRLTKVLEKWSNAGGSLNSQLDEISDRPVKSRAEAMAVGEALRALRRKPSLATSPEIPFTSLHALTSLVQYAATIRAQRKLSEIALPELRRYVQDLLNGLEVKVADVALIVLVLAIYGQPEDTVWIAAFAQSSYAEQGRYWSLTFEQFTHDPKRAQQLIDAFAGRLPTGFVAVAYLDMANMCALGGKLKSHPFDNSAGHQRLEQWLRDFEPEHYSYAHSATAALPFIDQEARLKLLEIACQHPDLTVRVESAWAMLKCGDRSAVQLLEAGCLDPRTSTRAQSYLKELGFGASIPAETQEPEFQALEKMSNWLASPNEFGSLPDVIELYDTRELYWPPINDRRRLWLVRYRYENSFGKRVNGVGMVGTILSPIDVPNDASPEDVYALYCCWELERLRDKRAPEKPSIAAGRQLLTERNPGFS